MLVLYNTHTITQCCVSEMLLLLLLTVALCSRLDQKSISANIVQFVRPLILDFFRHTPHTDSRQPLDMELSYKVSCNFTNTLSFNLIICN